MGNELSSRLNILQRSTDTGVPTGNVRLVSFNVNTPDFHAGLLTLGWGWRPKENATLC